MDDDHIPSLFGTENEQDILGNIHDLMVVVLGWCEHDARVRPALAKRVDIVGFCLSEINRMIETTGDLN
jgi:hypothetical protein